MHGVAAPRHVRQREACIYVVVRDAIHRLGNAPSVGVVGEGDRSRSVRHARQLPGVLPRVRPRAVACQVADGVRGQRLAVVGGEQVAPRAIAVGVEFILFIYLMNDFLRDPFPLRVILKNVFI